MNSSPNWEEVFDKVEHCSLCGEDNFMCDCGDLPFEDDYSEDSAF